MDKTGIEWTDRTWNPVTGCTKVSAGCKNCYAEPLALRLQRMGNPRYSNGFELTLHPDKVEEPHHWRDGAWVFVNSMSDLLHANVPDWFLLDVFRVMRDTPRHRYQVLTKRPERWESVTELVVGAFGSWPRNVLPGTSIENREVIEGTRKIPPRLQALGKAGGDGTVRMISAEPLLGSLLPRLQGAPGMDGSTDAMEFLGMAAADQHRARVAVLADELRDAGIGWVISGGESAFPRAYRPSDLDWFRELRDACAMAGIPFFHKQHGGPGVTKAIKRGGKLATLDGVLHHAMPSIFGYDAAPAKVGDGQLTLQ